MARPQKALVVDDLPLNRFILSTILHKLGFEVLEAENGLQCIDVYNQERTQLVCVFLDLQMPIADGWAATKGIRELESRTHGAKQPRVPVVVCTASCLDDLVENGQTVAQRALSLGADGAVRKPLTTFAVQRILDEYAPQWRGCSDEEDATPAAPLLLPAPESPLPLPITATVCFGEGALSEADTPPLPEYSAQAHTQAHPHRPQYHPPHRIQHCCTQPSPPPPLPSVQHRQQQQPPEQLQCGSSNQERQQPSCRSCSCCSGGGGGSHRHGGAAASVTMPEGGNAMRAVGIAERRTLSGAVRPCRDPPAQEPRTALDHDSVECLPPSKRPSILVPVARLV